MESFAYREMAEVENKHWWFVARRAILKSLINRFRLEGKTLEIGPGTGGNLELFNSDVTVLEPSAEAIKFLSCRNVKIIKGKLGEVETKERFQFIACLDVLEHLDNDKESLKQIFNLLEPEGKLLLTVPAYNFLWSSHDEELHHKRRYNLTELIKLVASSGFQIEFKSYFNFLLFPLALVSRLFGQAGRSLPGNAINTSLLKVFMLEKFLLKYLRFPFGLSIVVICKRKI